MRINRVILWLILFPIFPLLFTQDVISGEIPSGEEIGNEIFNNISHEYTTCAAYFRIMSEALRRSNDIETANNYEQASESALDRAFIAGQEGRTSEMAGKVVSSRFELETKSMLKEIDNNIENISILMNKHLMHCEEIMGNPDKIMREWLDKILKKYDLN